MVKTTERTKHLIAAESLGTIVSNILKTGDCGLLEIYPDIEFYLNGNNRHKLPHLQIGEDTIFLVGYSDVSKFKKVLGGQFGAIFIDECNIADMNFIRELFLPRFQYCLMTLNPDNPDKDIYHEFVNRARPIEEYKETVPKDIMKYLNSALPQKDWNYWFFDFNDNPVMSDERREKLLSSLLPDTREYITKILGKRTKGVGVIFKLPNQNIITEEKATEFYYDNFTCGVDTSYSSTSDDTFAFIFAGITTCNKIVILEEKVMNNRDLREPLTPSDIAVEITDFLNDCQNKWGICNSVFIDSADQATITECRKYQKARRGNFNFINAYKKTKIIDRINLQNSWIAKGCYLINESCKNHIKEHNTYSWLPNKDIPEDGNDHTINASQYSWLPFKEKIGK